jgi:hypothetical protein
MEARKEVWGGTKQAPTSAQANSERPMAMRDCALAPCESIATYRHNSIAAIVLYLTCRLTAIVI